MDEDLTPIRNLEPILKTGISSRFLTMYYFMYFLRSHSGKTFARLSLRCFIFREIAESCFSNIFAASVCFNPSIASKVSSWRSASFRHRAHSMISGVSKSSIQPAHFQIWTSGALKLSRYLFTSGLLSTLAPSPSGNCSAS